MFAVVYNFEPLKFCETELSQDDFMLWAKASFPYAEVNVMFFNERPYFASDESDIETLTHEQAHVLIELQKHNEHVKEHNEKTDNEIRLLTANLPVRTVNVSSLLDIELIQAFKEEGYEELARGICSTTLIKYLDGYQEAYDKVKDRIEVLEKQRIKE